MNNDFTNWNENPDLNITPLVDIMLVLLAILMISTPALVYKEQITLPNGTKTQAITKMPTLEISINKKREVSIKDDHFSLSSFADNFILLSPKYSKDTPVFIRADKSLLYEDVMYILKSVKNAGFAKVALETGG